MYIIIFIIYDTFMFVTAKNTTLCDCPPTCAGMEINNVWNSTRRCVQKKKKTNRRNNYSYYLYYSYNRKNIRFVSHVSLRQLKLV
jgi:hypothetical protein